MGPPLFSMSGRVLFIEIIGTLWSHMCHTQLHSFVIGLDSHLKSLKCQKKCSTSWLFALKSTMALDEWANTMKTGANNKDRNKICTGWA